MIFIKNAFGVHSIRWNWIFTFPSEIALPFGWHFIIKFMICVSFMWFNSFYLRQLSNGFFSLDALNLIHRFQCNASDEKWKRIIIFRIRTSSITSCERSHWRSLLWLFCSFRCSLELHWTIPIATAVVLYLKWSWSYLSINFVRIFRNKFIVPSVVHRSSASSLIHSEEKKTSNETFVCQKCWRFNYESYDNHRINFILNQSQLKFEIDTQNPEQICISSNAISFNYQQSPGMLPCNMLSKLNYQFHAEHLQIIIMSYIEHIHGT